MYYDTDDWSSNNKELVAIIKASASKAHLQKTFTLDESIDRCLKLSEQVRKFSKTRKPYDIKSAIMA